MYSTYYKLRIAHSVPSRKQDFGTKITGIGTWKYIIFFCVSKTIDLLNFISYDAKTEEDITGFIFCENYRRVDFVYSDSFLDIDP